MGARFLSSTSYSALDMSTYSTLSLLAVLYETRRTCTVKVLRTIHRHILQCIFCQKSRKQGTIFVEVNTELAFMKIKSLKS